MLHVQANAGAWTALNLVNNDFGPEGALYLASALKVKWKPPSEFVACCVSADALASQGNGALSKLIFSGDDRQSKPVTVEVGMTEADFSAAVLQSEGAIILAAWFEHKVQCTTQTHYC